MPTTNSLFCFQVMEDTNTQISWPSKLKIGAKSKKGKRLGKQGEMPKLSVAYLLLFKFRKSRLVSWDNFVCHDVICFVKVNYNLCCCK